MLFWKGFFIVWQGSRIFVGSYSKEWVWFCGGVCFCLINGWVCLIMVLIFLLFFYGVFCMIEDQKFVVYFKFLVMGMMIFMVMLKLVVECGVVNLLQGFFDFQVEMVLFDVVYCQMLVGCNQYLLMVGVFELCQVIVDKVEVFYGLCFDVEFEVMVMVGVMQVIFMVIVVFVWLGDEVIVFELVYDFYVLVIEIVGGMVVYVQFKFFDYVLDWVQVEVLIMLKMWMIIVNLLNNLMGSLLIVVDLEKLVKMVCGIDIVILFDEVYEYIVFDGE